MRTCTAVASIGLAFLLPPPASARAGEGEGAPPVQLGVARAHPRVRELLRPVKTVGVLVPRVDVFELGANGQRTFSEEWSIPARKTIAQAVAAAVAARGFAVKPLEEATAAAQDDLLDVRLLYEAVGSSILFAVYQQRFPVRVERFEYALGDVSRLLDALGVDALAIAYASDEVSSGGRKAAQAATTVGLALLGVIAVPRGGMTRMNVGVVDRSGAVAWFNAGIGRYDLRDANSAGMLVSSLLAELPRAEAP